MARHWRMSCTPTASISLLRYDLHVAMQIQASAGSLARESLFQGGQHASLLLPERRDLRLFSFFALPALRTQRQSKPVCCTWSRFLRVAARNQVGNLKHLRELQLRLFAPQLILKTIFAQCWISPQACAAIDCYVRSLLFSPTPLSHPVLSHREFAVNIFQPVKCAFWIVWVERNRKCIPVAVLASAPQKQFLRRSFYPAYFEILQEF